jgi:hypothetical protein
MSPVEEQSRRAFVQDELANFQPFKATISSAAQLQI